MLTIDCEQLIHEKYFYDSNSIDNITNNDAHRTKMLIRKMLTIRNVGMHFKGANE